MQDVCCEVLLWLEGDPDTTAKDLMARLSAAQPERFGDARLRTLQRRGQDWCRVIAKKLVYADVDEPSLEGRVNGELALVGTVVGV